MRMSRYYPVQRILWAEADDFGKRFPEGGSLSFTRIGKNWAETSEFSDTDVIQQILASGVSQFSYCSNLLAMQKLYPKELSYGNYKASTKV